MTNTASTPIVTPGRPNWSGAFSGKVALVTGASRGIGAAIAGALAAAGASVVLAARDEAALASQVIDIRAHGGVAVALVADVTSEQSVRGLLAEVRRRVGRLDIAVNNAAGGGHLPTPLGDWTNAEFDSSIDSTLRGTFLSLKYELELMLEREGGGAIVNLSSTAGEQGVAGLAGYVASKFGIGGLTKVAALDYAAAGIRVNAIAPGPILTDRLASASDEALANVAAAVPLGRVGTARDVADAAVWLCSDAASFVTGTVLSVDGGRLAGTPAFKTTARTGMASPPAAPATPPTAMPA
ncbi:SDR family NAD(P)-dependent oxidoreductase [Leifsonia sp. A12D58]|uniref:SDR family NAD(P)-dependent oxidoreductase n=1 Tax=Leifsonia sp. A12D58 TaxID=3397674 RepID=UPI0039E13579